MGNAAGKIKPAPASFGVMSVRFNEGTISALHAPKDVVTALRNTIEQYWQGVLSESRPHAAVHNFNLKNYETEEKFWDDMQSTLLFLAIIRVLHQNSWKLILAPDIFQTIENAELMFHLTPNGKENQSEDVPFCIRLDEENQLQVSGAPDAAIKIVKEALGKYLELLKDFQSEYKGLKNVQILLKTAAWKTTDDKVKTSSGLAIAEMIGKLHNAGYELTNCACLDGQRDTWFFDKVPAGKAELCLISLVSKDVVMAFKLPKATRGKLVATFKKYWKKGEIREKEFSAETSAIKIVGDPWMASEKTSHAQTARLLVLRAIETMHKEGWQMIDATDVSQEPNDKSVFIFRQMPPEHSVSHNLMAIQPIGKNMLWVINAPTDIERKLSKVFKSLLGEALEEQHSRPDGTEVYEFTGTPWRPDNEGEAILARHVICVVMHCLMSHGWTPICAADIQGHAEEADDVNKFAARKQRAQKKMSGQEEEAVFSSDTHIMIFQHN